MRILVVGGGIGGLTAGIVLGRLGHEVTVAERSAHFDTVGAGIGVGAGAEAILDRLGVDRTAVGAPIRRLEVRDAGGRVLQGVDAGDRAGPPMRAYVRSELHTALVAAAGEVVDLRPGCAPDAGLRGEHELVVGADGIGSATREAVVGAVPVRYSGATCWRAIVPNVGVEASFEAWGDGARVGGIPLTGGRLYCFLVRVCPRRTPPPPDVPTLRGWFAGVGGEAGRVVASLDRLPPHHHDLDELEHPTWGAGTTVLIGDAAHAITPNLGFGASLAIEDAVALGLALAEGVGADEVVDALRRTRHRRVRAVQLRSRRVGQIAQLRGRVLVRSRDLLSGATPDALVRRQQATLMAPGEALAARLVPLL